MSDLGKMLQQARLEKGITLDELQDSTKIRKRYLQAIENEEFSVLPGNFYVRAFIKSYAEAVGLDPDEVLKLYGNVIPQTTREAGLRPEPVRSKTKTKKMLKNTDRVSRWAATFLVITFFALIVAVIYIYVLKNYEGSDKRIVDNDDRITDQVEQEQDPNDKVSIISPPAGNEETSGEDQEAPPEPDLQYVTTDGDTHIYTLTNADQVRLELTVVQGECWISVKEGNSEGTELFQGKLYADDVRSWEASSSLYIRLGYPLSSQIEVNGIAIEEEKMNSKNPMNYQINLGQQESNG